MLPMPCGRPRMPSGVVGSVSHKGPLAAALVAAGRDGIGVDVEHVDELDATLERKVLTPGERARLADTNRHLQLHAIVAHFSVKEAIYKSLATERQRGLEFDDIDVNLASLREGEWIVSEARVKTVTRPFRTAVLIDGQWILAAARASCETLLP